MSRTTPNLVGRNGKIWQGYIRGNTQPRLAEKYGITTGRVCQIIKEVRESLEPESIPELRAVHVDTLKMLQSMLADIVDSGPNPAYTQSGKLVLDENECVIEDHTQRMKAIQQLMQIEKRLSDLLGLNAERDDMSAKTEEAISAVSEISDALSAVAKQLGETNVDSS